MEYEELVQAVQSLASDDAFRTRLDAQQWRALGGFLTQHPLRAGEMLIRQGEVDRSAYFLGQGTLQAFSEDAGHGGSRVVLLRPGSLVGEMGLFGALPPTANVEAMSRCVVWALRLPRFEELSSRLPSLALEVLRGAGAVMAARMQAHVLKQAALA